MPPSDQEPRYQLVDSNGNVVGSLFGDGSGNVVIADETDTQTKFDANGISTPALEANQVSSDAPTQFQSGNFIDLALDNGDLIGIKVGTTSVDSSATVIQTLFFGGLVLVNGEDGNTNQFNEIVHIGFRQSPKVISTITRNSPASRTYSMNDSDLELSMSSGTYQVQTFAIGLNKS